MTGISKIVQALFQTGKIDAFLGYREVNGFLLPYLFSAAHPEELASLVMQSQIPRYPLERILVAISRAHPGSVVGLVARDCEARALNELIKLNQIDPDKVVPIAVPCCQSELHAGASCSYLQPSAKDGEKKSLPPKGIGKGTPLGELEMLSLEERFQRWKDEFSKCIKCYGCRNVCPVYVCKECSLEDEELIPVGQIPPDFSFHLVRAVHMAGFCIDCGLCEEACPAEIPLRLLYRGGNQIVERLFGYKPGREGACSPFHRTGLIEKGSLS